MRTEHEMFTLILDVAKNDDRVRAVILNGSRANKNAIKDIFQDYDIVYVVKETKTFIEDKNWIDQFGKRLYMQYPEDNSYYPSNVNHCYGWLIQFTDGNRLDLHVCTLNHTLKVIIKDSLTKVLLDKDKSLPDIPPATDEDYWVKKPSEKEFLDTCNEFWWCLNNVAKGLWREEIPYVMDMINKVVRPQLIYLLEWKIGYKTDFSVSVGKSGKYMYKWLEKTKWDMFLKTYSSGVIKDIWEAVFIMCDLFILVAKEVACLLNFNYNIIEANNSYKFLRTVYSLPKDAKEIFMSEKAVNLIGKCGFYCGSCPTHASGKCPGCRTAHTKGDCFTFDCVDNQKIDYCGLCGKCPCDEIMTKEKATVLDLRWLKWKRLQKDKMGGKL
mgnify:CR=1 FL=1